jgi:hypothetical protein
MVKLFNAVYAARRMPLCQDRSTLNSTSTVGGIDSDSRRSRNDLGCISVFIRAVKTEISGWRDWVNYTFTETGTGSATIEFDAYNTPGYHALNNVSVSGPSPIPEPSSFLLMGAA